MLENWSALDSLRASGQSPSQGMADLLEEVEAFRSLRMGEVVQGQVMRVDQDSILVNIGHKSEGLIPQREMRSLSEKDLQALQVGDEILASVVEPAGEEGQVILSLDQAREEQGWRTLEQHLEDGQPLKACITGFNRGGAIVDVGGVQGFVPLSQLAPIPRGDGDSQQALARRVSEQVSLKVLEVDRRRNRAVLSERTALQEQRREQKDQFLQELREGETRRGRVTGISSFGAFVDLGGADGLIHISEMAWEPVRSPEDVVHVGQEVEVYVLRVDRESQRIALSLRRLHPEPWDDIAQRYQVGQMVTGTVTNLVTFGAFARLEGGIEGLIHISELSDRLLHHPKEVVKEGDILTLRIVSLEPERRRIGLSVKQADLPLEG